MQATKRAETPVFVPGDLDLWPWHSNSSERGTKHVFRVNLRKFVQRFPRYFIHKQTKTKSHRQRQKQNLTQFTACGNYRWPAYLARWFILTLSRSSSKVKVVGQSWPALGFDSREKLKFGKPVTAPRLKSEPEFEVEINNCHRKSHRRPNMLLK